LFERLCSNETQQYLSIKFPERPANAGIGSAVGSVGDSDDTALAETINRRYKAKLLHRHAPWRSFEAIGLATLPWVAWSNQRRRLEPIGNIPPAKAADRYFAELATQARAA